MEATVDTITLTAAGKQFTLTYAQAKEIHKLLNEMFAIRTERVVERVERVPVIMPSWEYAPAPVRPYGWPEITCLTKCRPPERVSGSGVG